MIQHSELCWVSEVAGIIYIESPFGHRGAVIEARFHCNFVYCLVNTNDHMCMMHMHTSVGVLFGENSTTTKK